jgi:hypothetical protein
VTRVSKDASSSLCSAVLRAAALLAPRPQRAEWLAGWQSELWYVQRKRSEAIASFDRASLGFCCGAFRDAIVLRLDPSLRDAHPPGIQSPWNCLAILGVLAVIAGWGFFRPGGASGVFMRGMDRGVGLGYFWSLALAVLALPSNRSLVLGGYPGRTELGGLRQFGRWVFLGAKFALILAIGFWGILDLAQRLTNAAYQPQGWIEAVQGCLLGPAAVAAYLAGFRWALRDQRRRCPVCLRLLANASRSGLPGQILVDYHSTEYFCDRGHSVLRVPEIDTSFSTRTWLSSHSR